VVNLEGQIPGKLSRGERVYLELSGRERHTGLRGSGVGQRDPARVRGPSSARGVFEGIG